MVSNGIEWYLIARGSTGVYPARKMASRFAPFREDLGQILVCLIYFFNYICTYIYLIRMYKNVTCADKYFDIF